MQTAGRKVAVVGMGGAFPTCKSVSEFGDKLFSDQSLIREWPLALEYKKQIRSTVSGYITEEEMDLEPVLAPIADKYPETYIDKLGRIPDINLATSDMGSIWGMLGAQDCVKMAGWTKQEVESEQTGIVVGSGGAGNVVLRVAWQYFFVNGAKARAAGSHTVDRTMFYRDAANISCLLKTKGVCEAIGSACATGLGNIGYAYRLIKYGMQDRIIAGGLESTSLETFIGFDGMMILSKGFNPAESSRPFDMQRNGFVCSFGAGIVALEEYEMAKARGAKILGVIEEYFNNSDGDGDMFYPSFGGQQRMWRGLMNSHGFKPDVVKMHGTSTPVGDSVELLSVVDALGEEGYHVSAPKSQFGHMLGGAGSVEFIAALLMLERQTVSPCLNSNTLNPELENFQKAETWRGPHKPLAEYRRLVPQKAFSKEINRVACLNYGFGGTNSALMLARDLS
jgi:3-oxoacyl-[acyl-carrier-protein] synthase-1